MYLGIRKKIAFLFTGVIPLTYLGFVPGELSLYPLVCLLNSRYYKSPSNLNNTG